MNERGLSESSYQQNPWASQRQQDGIWKGELEDSEGKQDVLFCVFLIYFIFGLVGSLLLHAGFL